jgi:prevent-host-death family protein
MKTHLARFLTKVEKGQEIIITKREKPVARLIPFKPSVSRKDVFDRINALRGTLKLAKGESLKDLINAGRRM